MNGKRLARIFTLTALAIGLIAAGAWQRWMSGAWHDKAVTVWLPPGLTAPELADTLSQQLPEGGQRVVDHVAMRDWTVRLKPGRYTFPAHEAVKQSAARLVTGARESVNVVVPSGRDVGPVAGATARRIFADSSDVAELFERDSMRWRIVLISWCCSSCCSQPPPCPPSAWRKPCSAARPPCCLWPSAPSTRT